MRQTNVKHIAFEIARQLALTISGKNKCVAPIVSTHLHMLWTAALEGMSYMKACPFSHNTILQQDCPPSGRHSAHLRVDETDWFFGLFQGFPLDINVLLQRCPEATCKHRLPGSQIADLTLLFWGECIPKGISNST